jgi:hypothetical protein
MNEPFEIEELKTIHLNYKDGSHTVAAIPSIALIHWYFSLTPRTEVPSEDVKVEYIAGIRTEIGKPVTGPYDKLFLKNICDAIAVKFNVPDSQLPRLLVPSKFFSSFWYENLSGFNPEYRKVQEAIKEGNPDIIEYEQVCQDILYYLALKNEFELEFTDG